MTSTNLRLLAMALVIGVTACGAQAPTLSGNGSDQPGGGRPFTVSEIATFDSPSGMAFLPGSSTALVTEKPGRLWLVDVGTGRKTEVSGVPDVAAGGQGGLLEVALSPRFASDGLVYLTYSEPSPQGGRELAMARGRLARQSAARLQDVHVLWRDPAGGRGGQFGGRIAFAPDGDSLFLAVGERQRFTPAQDLNQPLGKILHLTLDGKAAPGNPMAGRPGAPTVTITDPPEDTEAARHAPGRRFAWPGPNPTPSEIWTIGHRNQYGLAFAPDGRLWEAEAGPAGGDELNLIEKGRNYGWPVVSNGDNYNGVPISPHSSRPEFEAPKVFWTPTITPGGLLIYTGGSFPKWKGDALIPGLNGQVLVRVDIEGGKATKADEWDMGHRLRAIAQGPDGAVYLLEDGPGGKLLKLAPAN